MNTKSQRSAVWKPVARQVNFPCRQVGVNLIRAVLQPPAWTMKRITLTQGKNALVDDSDFAALSAYKWCFGCGGYACRKENGKIILMHRQVLSAPTGLEVDHISRDKLDNQRLNLRLCTRSQNAMNSSGYLRTNTGLRGIYWMASRQRFRVTVRKDGRRITFGYFHTAAEAAAAYNAESARLHGPFAFQNRLPAIP